MSNPLEVQAREILASAPASVELPAGTGKTHLLTASVREAANRGHRSLILTHTNAGVDAIRKRLSEFQVSSKLFRIDTITGWAFTLARSYQTIAEVVIPDIPDWEQSAQYLTGAIKVARASSIKEVVKLSYDYLLVDEYQDCTKTQHELILALKDSIFQTIVFGDPLQSIFGFKERLVDWKTDVQSAFPAYEVELIPHRWKETNPALGQFTLDIRSSLQPGNIIDLDDFSDQGVNFVRDESRSLTSTCFSLTRSNETVAVLTDYPSDEDNLARRLSGHFCVIEPISSRRMNESLKRLPSEGSHLLAHWFAAIAKDFHVGLAGVDSALLRKLKAGDPVAGLRRKGLENLLSALARLQEKPSYQTLLDIQGIPHQIDGVRCSHREAWRDIFRAIQYGVDEQSTDMLANLGVIRSQYKHTERRMPNFIVSRTLIVKGLEFDHVVIADLAKFDDPRHLYVALSRARKSVTILGKSSTVRLKKSKW